VFDRRPPHKAAAKPLEATADRPTPALHLLNIQPYTLHTPTPADAPASQLQAAAQYRSGLGLYRHEPGGKFHQMACHGAVCVLNTSPQAVLCCCSVAVGPALLVLPYRQEVGEADGIVCVVHAKAEGWLRLLLLQLLQLLPCLVIQTLENDLRRAAASIVACSRALRGQSNYQGRGVEEVW
jgi:hypothetical protein